MPRLASARRERGRVLQGAPTVRKDKAPSSSPLSAVAPVARRVIRSSERPSDDALDIGPELRCHIEQRRAAEVPIDATHGQSNAALSRWVIKVRCGGGARGVEQRGVDDRPSGVHAPEAYPRYGIADTSGCCTFAAPEISRVLVNQACKYVVTQETRHIAVGEPGNIAFAVRI